MDTNLAFQNADILRAIAAHGPALALAELARLTGRDKSNLHKTVGRLVDAGVLTRDAEKLEVNADAHRIIAAADLAEGKTEANPVRHDAPEGFTTALHHRIQIGALNPRKDFDGVALLELADDILARGLKQNLLVRPTETTVVGSGEAVYELVAGERRWRAIGLLIKRGDLPEDWPIPVKVEVLDDKAHALAALLENLQRVDLTPLEEAAAFDQLVNMNGWSTAQVADKVSKTQRFVQLRLQLLKLTDDQKARLNKGELTVKQALAAISNRPEPVEVTPIELLALALIWTNAYPKPEQHLSYWKKGECHFDADFQPIIARLIARGMVVIEEPTKYAPRHEIGTTHTGFMALNQHAQELTTAETEDQRKGAMMSIDNAAYAFDKAASAEALGLNQWLGKPAINSHVVQKLIDERMAEEKAQQDTAAQREADRQAAKDKAEQEEAAGLALLDQIRAFEAEAPTLAPAEFAQAFAGLMTSLGYTGPFTIGLWSPNGGQGAPALHDSQGTVMASNGSRFLASRRLQAIALNRAIGSAIVWSGPDLDDAPAEEDQAEQEHDDDQPDPENEVEFLDIVTEQFTRRHGVEAALALKLTHEAYKRLTDDVGEFGSEDADWTHLDARMVADGWAEDFPDTLAAVVTAEEG